MNTTKIIDATRQWIETMVIGLNLCPFAQRVFVGEKIRYVVSDVRDEIALLAQLDHELQSLVAMPPERVETTLIIHPEVLVDFLDYNDFLADADRLIRKLKLDGVIQIASFHPRYQFAESKPDAVENYTNRSPYPMLHFLREASITQTAWAAVDLEAIPKQNIETLRRLGIDAIRKRVQGEVS